jgi:CheY-like chemotaxis protein
MAPAAAARPESQNVRDLKNLRVLIVEDHSELARMFATLLRANGCNVVVAEQGMTAITLAAAFRPEVMLLDIRLPDIDGFEVAERIIKEMGAHRPLIIAVTAYSQDRYREQAYEAGIDLYLSKPVSGTELLKSIRETPISE